MREVANGYDVKTGRRTLAKLRRRDTGKISCSIGGLVWFYDTMDEAEAHIKDYFTGYFQFLVDHVIFCTLK